MAASLKQMFDRWSEITGTPAERFAVRAKYEKLMEEPDGRISLDNMRSWLIRECDRADHRDWMPHRVRTFGHCIRVYYVNVNKESKAFENSLVLVLTGNCAEFDEWNGGSLISRSPAVIEDAPAVKPTDEDFVQVASYIALNGGKPVDPPTFEGIPVGTRLRLRT